MRSIDCIDGKCSSGIRSPTCTFPRRFQTSFFIMFWYQRLNSGKSQNHVNSPPSTPSPKEILILCSFTHFSHRPVKCVIASTAARQRDKERQSWQKDTYWQWGMGKPAWGTCVRSVEGSRVQRPCEHPLVRGVLQAAPSPSSLQTVPQAVCGLGSGSGGLCCRPVAVLTLLFGDL